MERFGTLNDVQNALGCNALHFNENSKLKLYDNISMVGERQEQRSRKLNTFQIPMIKLNFNALHRRNEALFTINSKKKNKPFKQDLNNQDRLKMVILFFNIKFYLNIQINCIYFCHKLNIYIYALTETLVNKSLKPFIL